MKTTRDNSMRNCQAAAAFDSWREVRCAAMIQITACALTRRLNLHVMRCVLLQSELRG